MSDFSDSDLEVDTLDENFTHATEHIQRTHDIHTPNDLLELYALYKQATTGRCNTAKPNLFQMQARAKWCAWNDLADMTAADAKRLYIEKVKSLDSSWHDALQKGGKRQKSLSNWVVHSIQLPPDEDGSIPQKAEHDKDAFDYVKERNLMRLTETIKPQNLHELDEHGLGLIHWATDRNDADILQYLISLGVDINFRDAEQQTALHFATNCGHLECLRILLAANADRSAKDADGQTCIDVAENDEVRELLNC